MAFERLRNPLPALACLLFLVFRVHAQGEEPSQPPPAAAAVFKAKIPVGVFALPAEPLSVKTSLLVDEIGKENLRRNKQFSVNDPEAALTGGAPLPGIEALQKGTDAARIAKQSYDGMELDDAMTNFKRAYGEFQKALPYMGKGDQLLNIMIYIGATYLLQGDIDHATDAFKLILLYDKKVKLSEKYFSPQMIELFESTRENMKEIPAGSLTLSSEPENVKVFLDGRYVGNTPLIVPDILSGPHYIRMERDGYRKWALKLDVKPRVDNRVVGKIEPAPAFMQYTDSVAKVLEEVEDGDFEEATPEFGKWLGYAKLLLASVKHRGDEVRVKAYSFDVVTGKTEAEKDQTFNIKDPNFTANLGGMLSSLCGVGGTASVLAVGDTSKTSTSITPGVGSGATCLTDADCGKEEHCDMEIGRCVPNAPEGAKFYQKWWFWTIVGAAAAGGAAGYYFLKPEGPQTGTIMFVF